MSSESSTSSLAPVKTVSILGREIPRQSVERALYSASGFFVVFNAFFIPFALPKLRVFLGAPYLPSSTKAFNAVLDHIPQLSKPGLRMVDIGSGDGRLVIASGTRGIQSLGIEMNPWLVGLSKFRLVLNRLPPSSIKWANAWTSKRLLSSFQPDMITFYGRPGQGVMTKFGKLAEDVSDSTGKELIVVSNKFQIPGWNIRLIANVGDFYVYRLHSDRL